MEVVPQAYVANTEKSSRAVDRRKTSFNEIRGILQLDKNALQEVQTLSLYSPDTPKINASEIQWDDSLETGSPNGSSPNGGSKTDVAALHRAQSLKSAASLKLGRALSSKLNRLASKLALPSYLEDVKPTRELSSDTQRHLDVLCRKGIEFLTRLQEPAYSRREVDKEPILPKTALRFSKGLAFIWQRKAGLIGSYTWGFGFLIARLGPNQWSAPLFLSDSFLSVGATFGFRYINTFYAIPNDEGMLDFKHNFLDFNIDLAITMGVDPSLVDAPTAVLSTDRVSFLSNDPSQPKAYAISDGAIIDASLRFGMHSTDAALNWKVYGEKITPDDILAGKVQSPEQFQPLYDYLSSLSATAAVVRSTQSEFEAASKMLNKTGDASSSQGSGSGLFFNRSKSRKSPPPIFDDAARWSPHNHLNTQGSNSQEGTTTTSLMSLPEDGLYQSDLGASGSDGQNTIPGSGAFSLFPELPGINLSDDDEEGDDEKGKAWQER